MLRFAGKLVIALAVAVPALAAEPFVPIDPATNAPYRGNFAPVDHLEPEPTVLSIYPGVLDVFPDIFKENVLVRMFVFPSFAPAYAVGIEENNGTYQIVTLNLGLRPNEIQSQRRNIQEVDRCEVRLVTPIAEHLVNVWREMLLRTKYATTVTDGADGAEFHYSSVGRRNGARRVFHDMAGRTWEPDPKSSPGMLVSISSTMWKYCETRDPALGGQLDRQAIALLTRLGVPP